MNEDFGEENELDSQSYQNRWDGGFEESMQVEFDEYEDSRGSTFEQNVGVELDQGQFEWNRKAWYHNIDVNTVPSSTQDATQEIVSPMDDEEDEWHGISSNATMFDQGM